MQWKHISEYNKLQNPYSHRSIPAGGGKKKNPNQHMIAGDQYDAENKIGFRRRVLGC